LHSTTSKLESANESACPPSTETEAIRRVAETLARPLGHGRRDIGGGDMAGGTDRGKRRRCRRSGAGRDVTCSTVIFRAASPLSASSRRGPVRARRPLYSECLFISLEQAPERHTKVLFLPLSDDGENQVLVVQVFLYIDPATRQRRFIEPRPFKEIAHLVFEVPSGVEMARR